MFAPGPALLELSARRNLRQLNTMYGVPAAAAAAQAPGLSAQLDQHGAAVRDILAFGVGGSARIPIAILLSGYARGLLDQVAEALLPAAPHSWHTADWWQLRLAAVCLHAEPA
ncbi:hypothetical protein ATM97_24500 [Nocardia sp. MH4]|nr:hypothetical protein [Nocardia sp. MH4]